jgi:hypothetical protein
MTPRTLQHNNLPTDRELRRISPNADPAINRARIVTVWNSQTIQSELATTCISARHRLCGQLTLEDQHRQS